MATLVKLEPAKTYATGQNAVKAFEAKFGPESPVRYVIMQTPEGRFFPVGIGESAVQAGVHFSFNVLG